MLTYIIQRLLQGIVVIWLITLLTFFILQLAPGDPVDLLVGEGYVTEETKQRIREKWGFDRPIHEQYVTWLGNVLTGDLGNSVIRTGMPVSEMIIEAAPWTLRLNLLSFIISTSIAIPVGVIAALRRSSAFDYGSTVGATLGVAVPNYWIGLMLILLFSVQLGWLPTYGSSSWRAYLLPVFVLAAEEMAVLVRLTRGATLEALSHDHVVTARAKGLSQRAVTVGHVVRNAMLSVVTIIGLRIAFILSGTIVVETIFAWPGIGRLFYSSVNQLDYQVVQAVVLVLTTIVVLVNILTDITYAFIDPRVRVR